MHCSLRIRYVGRMIRAKTFSSSHIEPWLIHVEEYVLLDAEGSVEMYRAAEMCWRSGFQREKVFRMCCCFT